MILRTAYQLTDVHALVILQHGDDTLFRDADQHDRFVMFHQQNLLDNALHIHGDKLMNRFARITGSVHVIRSQKYKAELRRPIE